MDKNDIEEEFVLNKNNTNEDLVSVDNTQEHTSVNYQEVLEKNSSNASLKSPLHSALNSSSNTHINEKNALTLEAYRYMHEGELHKAAAIIRNARLLDMKDKRLNLFYNTINYWIQKITEVSHHKDPLKKGDLLFSYWHEFVLKQEKYKQNKAQLEEYVLDKELLGNFKKLIIGLSFRCYQHALNLLPSLKTQPEFELKQYYCLKNLEEYEEALALIQSISQKNTSSINIYCELADCHYLTKNMNTAKLLFREVFFLNPTEVKIENIKTPFIHEIVRKIQKESRYQIAYIKYWIPVYGYLMKTFNITREIKPIELHNIENEISNLEAKLEDHKALGKDDVMKLIPILLNRYIWMLEHLHNTLDPQSESYKLKIQIIYNKIKNHDEVIYEKLLQMPI